MRPHETLTNANSKVLYRMNNIFFWQHQCIVKIFFLNGYKIHFIWMLKINNELFCQRCLIEHPKKKIWQIFFIIFCQRPWKIIFEPLQYFLHKQCNFYCKAPKKICMSLYTTTHYCTTLYCSVLHYTLLHCTLLHCTLLLNNVLLYTLQHCTPMYSTPLHSTLMHCTLLHSTLLLYTLLHCTLLHCTPLYSTPLQYTLLHCTTDHCTVHQS